jgi:beta-galactosidase
MIRAARVLLIVTVVFALSGCTSGRQGRKVLRLDGNWQIAEGAMDAMPASFDHRVDVPGLADGANPPFEAVGEKASLQHRQAFWYRHRFRIKGRIPAVAKLKIHKAAFGTRVYINGVLAGDHLPCFTPAYFDVRSHLKGRGEENELVVRVGALPEALPRSIPTGWDFEKVRYIPGIYDSVDLILTGTPSILRMQAVPDIAGRKVRLVAEVQNSGPHTEVPVVFTVREAKSGKIVGELKRERKLRLGDGEMRSVDVTIPIPDCRLWSPEDPFLYQASVDVGTDSLSTRFGMRSFSFDRDTGRAMLNGRPYALRGTNVCIYRFFEDPVRGDRPWREEWVRRLHRVFKSMNWNGARYCIGFPPETWYDIADEEGFLIQDEFPLWHLESANWPKELTADELIAEYTEWMQERWNHPSVIIWDAQNETVTGETGKAIQAVRSLDLSNRPWDNGWSAPQAATDVYEAHPYAMQSSKETRIPTKFRLADFATLPTAPGLKEGLTGNAFLNTAKNPVVINEYGWMWLNRDGTPTTLTEANYRAMLDPDSTAEQRRELYARILAAKTEFWRSHRQVAGVFHFCGLGYSRPGGETSDHFIDLEKLELDPHFVKYVRDSFAPVGIMVDEWAAHMPPAKPHTVRVAVINDLDDAWSGTVNLRLSRGGEDVLQQSKECRVEAYGREVLEFQVDVPANPGHYELAGELAGKDPVRSYREFDVP